MLLASTAFRGRGLSADRKIADDDGPIFDVGLRSFTSVRVCRARQKASPFFLQCMSPEVCRFSAAGMTVSRCAEAAGGRKAPRHEVAGSSAPSSNNDYGDCTSPPLSMVGTTAVRDDMHACMQTGLRYSSRQVLSLRYGSGRWGSPHHQGARPQIISLCLIMRCTPNSALVDRVDFATSQSLSSRSVTGLSAPNVNDANGIVLANPVFQAIGKQRALRAIKSLNKSLHPNPPANRARIITRESDEAARFYTTRVIRVGSGLSAFGSGQTRTDANDPQETSQPRWSPPRLRATPRSRSAIVRFPDPRSTGG